MCTVSQASLEPGNPFKETGPICATAEFRPMVAIMPLSRYRKGFLPLPVPSTHRGSSEPHTGLPAWPAPTAWGVLLLPGGRQRRRQWQTLLSSAPGRRRYPSTSRRWLRFLATALSCTGSFGLTLDDHTAVRHEITSPDDKRTDWSSASCTRLDSARRCPSVSDVVGIPAKTLRKLAQKSVGSFHENDSRFADRELRVIPAKDQTEKLGERARITPLPSGRLLRRRM